ncbi:MAG TPA: aldo/keto reductase [Thermomicrobiales bacterium]|nr:aldo/keto reductase [Thermomicrobiales bacterium]
MEECEFGTSGLRTSAIGFGTWPIGGTYVKEGYGGVDDAEAIRAIRHALDLGVTCFDTAPAYGLGRAERLLGQALGPRRQDVAVVTKCGIPFIPEERRFGRDATYDHILAEVEQSLRNLGTDYVDLILIHWPDVKTPAEETMRALNHLRESGKARYVGVSNFSPEQMAACLEHGPLHAEQVGYNLFDRRREAETFPFCREHGIGVMAYGPLAHGLLTGAFTADTTFGEQDWRASGSAFGLPIFAPDNLARNVAVVDRLRAFAAERGRTVAQLALAWALHEPAVSVALVGARTAAEIETALPAANWKLTDADLAEIAALMAGAAGNA